MPQDVCYERLRPRQVAAAREACPVGYLPLGILEWHGLHNPVGNDGILAHALAVRCAQEGGGLVLPPLWYGESREEGLMDTAGEREAIAAEMHLPLTNFAPGFMRASPQEQYERYQRLLLHCLYQMRSLGFKVLVLVAGHYPLLDHARAACSLYHQARFNGRRADAIAWAMIGYELVQDVYPMPGDHSGYWETSMNLALAPALTDLSELPNDPKQKPVGVITERPVQEASAEFGEKMVRLIVERVVRQVQDRLRNPQAYYPHGARL